MGIITGIIWSSRQPGRRCWDDARWEQCKRLEFGHEFETTDDERPMAIAWSVSYFELGLALPFVTAFGLFPFLLYSFVTLFYFFRFLFLWFVAEIGSDRLAHASLEDINQWNIISPLINICSSRARS